MKQGERRPGMSRRDFLRTTALAAAASPALLALAGCAATGAPPTGNAGSLYFERAFGVDQALLRRVMDEALAKGGDYCDLYFQHSGSTYLIMEDGKVNRAHTSVSLGVGVRVLNGMQTGYAFSQSLEPQAMLEAARAAAELSRGAGQAPGSRGVEVGPMTERPGLALYPLAPEELDPRMPERLAILAKVAERLSRADRRVVKTMSQLHDGFKHILVVNSEGVLRQDLRPRTSLMASCVAEQDGRRESNHRDVTSRHGLSLYTPELIAELADEAVERTVALFEARPIASGEMPVVLAPGSAGILLHEAIGHGLEADFNRRRISTYAERMGQRVAGEHVTVVDDGAIAHAHGAIAFDDEGGDSMRTVLVDKGVLVSYLHDRLSAQWYKTASTGSGRRQSYEYAPMPRMRATYMEPGPHPPEEIIAQVKQGLYAEQFTNGQVNIGGGDFSFYVKSGRAIENGRLTHPVKDVNVTGNGPQALSRITMVGNDPALARAGYMCGKMGQTVPVSQGLPTTLVSAMNVGGGRGPA